MISLDHCSRITSCFLLAACTGLFANCGTSQAALPAAPYKIVNSVQVKGTGGIDYVYADSDGRRLYVPRGGEILVFDLDTLQQVGSIPNARAHGVAVDAKSHHGFATSNPVVMWDTEKLETIKTIPVKGRPDAIAFDPETERVFVFSHSEPNATVLDAKDGAIVGTIDLGGEPEQAASDGQGHLYVDIEDKGNIAVVDLKTLKVTAHYDLGGKGGPAGLGLDAKNRLLFAFCREPATAVILNADDGKILANLPIGIGTDSGGFNPGTLEAFSSQRDGTLTIIKETSPTTFAVEQNVTTMAGAKTCTLDQKTNRIILIALERTPDAAAATPSGTPNPAVSNPTPGKDRRGGNTGPALLHILVVGK
jgi:DNA-binding beta-propeller fold protein YncE